MLVNLASVWGRLTTPDVSAYVTSKFAVRAFTECLRQELRGERDIEIATILPTAVDTPIFAQAANFSGRRVRPVPPVVDPWTVADGIVRCAADPKREVTYGRVARLLELVYAFAPALYQRFAPEPSPPATSLRRPPGRRGATSNTRCRRTTASRATGVRITAGCWSTRSWPPRAPLWAAWHRGDTATGPVGRHLTVPDPTSDYSPSEQRPLAAYAVLSSSFFASLAGAVAAAHRGGRRFERPTASDIVIYGLATQKVSRLLAKDKVTSFLRAPFTRYQEPAGHGELEEAPRGEGLRYAVGELLVCPYCLAQWVIGAITVGSLYAPRTTKVVTAMWAAQAIADGAQLAYSAAEQRT